MKQIKLGDKVKCKLTGFTGIVVAKTEFINGCIQFNVLPRGTKNKMVEDMSIDETNLVLVQVKKKKKVERNGGATRFGYKMKGY